MALGWIAPTAVVVGSRAHQTLQKDLLHLDSRMVVWKLESTKEYVTTRLPNEPALKSDDALACYLYFRWDRFIGLAESQSRRSKGASLAADRQGILRHSHFYISDFCEGLRLQLVEARGEEVKKDQAQDGRDVPLCLLA